MGGSTWLCIADAVAYEVRLSSGRNDRCAQALGTDALKRKFERARWPRLEWVGAVGQKCPRQLWARCSCPSRRPQRDARDMRRDRVFGQLPLLLRGNRVMRLTTYQDSLETRRSGDPDACSDITRTQQANAEPVGVPRAGERSAGQD